MKNPVRFFPERSLNSKHFFHYFFLCFESHMSNKYKDLNFKLSQFDIFSINAN